MRKRKSIQKHKTILILTLLIVTSAGTFSYLESRKTNLLHPVTTNSVEKSPVVYPSQYSDKQITQNAIIADPRFINTSIVEKQSILANIASSIQKNQSSTKNNQKESGTWLWTPILDISPQYRNTIISNAIKNNINVIYLSIDSYLDIYVMEDGPQKDAKTKEFNKIVESFIKEAHKNGISVDAEAGWRNWAEPNHSYKALATLDYAIRYNETHTEKFRGLQYDVEPYLLDYYKNNKRAVLQNYIGLINKALTKLSGSDLEFSVVIPEFYDGSQKETPRFFYGFNFGYTFDHLLKTLERRPGSKIIVMAYRNFAIGENGTIEISKDEVKLANKYQTKIIIAQETGNVPPSYITFHNSPRSKYEKELKTIKETFTNNTSYGGVATHYINALMTLR